jgi:F-type H+-transporting ATPase subunit delta
MAEIKVSRRYAKSLLGLAQENNLTEKIFADMQLVADTCDENRELTHVMGNPIIPSFKKAAVLKAIFSDKVNSMTMNFMQMMISKGRVGLIDNIAREFIELYKEMRGVRTAHVTSAIKLDESTRNAVLAIVRKKGGESVDLIERVDPKIIGGFILRMGDVQFDSSVSRRLSDISRQLHSNSYTRN